MKTMKLYAADSGAGGEAVLTADERKEAAKAAMIKPFSDKAEEINKGRGEAKGTRVMVGFTRGRNTQPISYEGFDENLPKTLPVSIQEFLSLTGINVNDEARIVGLLIDGYNAEQYTLASDPIAEFVNPAWPADVQKSFRMAVRAYASATNGSIEDAVAVIKPGIDKGK